MSDSKTSCEIFLHPVSFLQRGMRISKSGVYFQVMAMTYSRFIHIKSRAFVALALLLFSCLCTPQSVFGADEDVSSVLFHEVSNSNTWSVFPLLSSVKLPEQLSVHLLMLFITMVVIFFLFFYAKHYLALDPRGFVVAIEEVILFMQNDIVSPVMGEERGKKWTPFFCTLFLFLLTTSLLGLIPAFKTATGNINVTTALAAMIFFLIFAVGFKNLGVRKFFANFYPEGIPLPIGLFVVILECLGIFIKSMVLSLRLFANMFAGHLVIFSFLMLIFVLNPSTGFFAVPCAVFTYLLEILVGLIQALVFTLLSCIFITMASSIHE